RARPARSWSPSPPSAGADRHGRRWRPRRAAVDQTLLVRISAKVDYAVRAMVQLAAASPDVPVKAEDIANAQDIPLKFLLGILNDLKRAYLVRSQRGAEGGYALARPADEITLADVIRVIDGPLANVHDLSLSELSYAGPAKRLREVWMAVRASLRSVLETTTLADLAAGDLPDQVKELASTYQAEERRQRARRR